MKVKVLVQFRDKKTGKIRKKDDIFIVSKERFAEILKVGNLVEEIKTEPEKAARRAE